MRRLTDNAKDQEIRDSIRELQDEVIRREEYEQDSGTSLSLDFASRPNHAVTLTGNVTLTSVDPPRPIDLRVRLIQDATGARTVTWFSDVLWASGTAPTVNTAANTVHVIGLYWNGTNYYGYTLGLSYA